MAHNSGVYVAVSTLSTSIASSTDLVTWVMHDVGSTYVFSKVIHDGVQFIAVGGITPSAGDIATSTNGTTWSYASHAGVGAFIDVVSVGSKIVVSRPTAPYIFVSTDNGVSFSPATTAPSVANYLGYSSGNFITVSGSSIHTSPDGFVWTFRDEGLTASYNSIATSPTSCIMSTGSPLVAVGIRSTDGGLTWAQPTFTPYYANGTNGANGLTASGGAGGAATLNGYSSGAGGAGGNGLCRIYVW